MEYRKSAVHCLTLIGLTMLRRIPLAEKYRYQIDRTFIDVPLSHPFGCPACEARASDITRKPLDEIMQVI